MRKFVLLFAMLMGFSFLAFAQNRTISGSVYDETGNAVPFTTISIKGTSVGASADASGNFTITTKSAHPVLIVSATGYITQEIIPNNSGKVVVNLKGMANTIEEVIVTAAGVKAKKKEIGNAATTISTQALNAGRATNVAAGLSGKVAGLMISGTSSGVNPNFRVVLRGQRSLTGNNQALIVIDNVIVPNDILGNINPNDVDDITILNGSGAAALYGSKASNGAIIISTKKGRNGQTAVTFSHTTTAEQVSFYPKLQTKYGGGGNGYGIDQYSNPIFSDLENQSYGPAFDGSKRPLGFPLPDGTINYQTYSYKPGHLDFWQKGLTNQEDISLTTGDDKSTLYLAGQYMNATGTTPGDKYNRAVMRINGTRKVGSTLLITYNTSYTQNRYNISGATSDIYNSLLNMPSSVDITEYKDWQNNPFANENGFYNPWYYNPYWYAASNRQNTRNDYLTGNVELKFTPVKGLDLIARQGISTRNWSYKYTQEALTYSEYARSQGITKSDVAASVTDYSAYYTELNTDLLAQYNKKFNDFSLFAIGGVQINANEQNTQYDKATGLVVPDLYNVSNRAGTPDVSQGNYKARQYGILGEVRVGYKDYLYLHLTGRQDKTSVLDPENNTFFYPSADVSFIVSDAFSAIKNSGIINYLKVRGGLSKVGQVNMGTGANPYGAYMLQPIYGQIYGYPYGNTPGYSAGDKLVNPKLKPEITKGWEAGFDLNFFRDRIVTSVTYYSTKTDNQTVTTNLAVSSGYTQYLTNVGATSSSGWEVTAHFTPLRTNDWEITVGGNYTFLKNMVDQLYEGQRLSIASYAGFAGSYAVEGMPFPMIMGYDYKRDPQGRVIVSSTTGLPTKTDDIVPLGQAQPKDRLGVDFQVRYKGITLSGLFDYRHGAVLVNNIGPTLDWSGTGYRTVAYDRQRFVFPNSVYLDEATQAYVPNTNIVVADGNDFWSDADRNMGVASNYVTSADFWKLRELSLSYDLPKKWLGSNNIIKGARVSLQGRNLFVWTPKDNIYTDPEYSAAGNDSNGIGLTGLTETPPSRFYGFNVTLRF